MKRAPIGPGSNSHMVRGEIAAQMIANVYGHGWDWYLTIDSNALCQYLALTEINGLLPIRNS